MSSYGWPVACDWLSWLIAKPNLELTKTNHSYCSNKQELPKKMNSRSVRRIRRWCHVCFSISQLWVCILTISCKPSTPDSEGVQVSSAVLQCHRVYGVGAASSRSHIEFVSCKRRHGDFGGDRIRDSVVGVEVSDDGGSRHRGCYDQLLESSCRVCRVLGESVTDMDTWTLFFTYKCLEKSNFLFVKMFLGNFFVPKERTVLHLTRLALQPRYRLG